MGSKELQKFIDNESLVALRKFVALEVQLKEAKEKHDAIIEKIKQAMIDNGVQRIDGDWGYITLAERTTYSAENIGAVDEKYIKPALDTAKVKAEAVLTGTLPSGVVQTKTQYITKKLKEV